MPTLSQKGNLPLARSLIRRALRLSTNDSILWSHYGRIEDRLNNSAHARALFRRACSVNPRDWYAPLSSARSRQHLCGHFQLFVTHVSVCHKHFYFFFLFFFASFTGRRGMHGALLNIGWGISKRLKFYCKSLLQFVLTLRGSLWYLQTNLATNRPDDKTE